MTSKIIVNTIEADTGISSVTFASNINLQNDSSILVSSSGVTLGTGSTIAAPSANELALSTNSAERLRIDSAGNVGINVIPTNYSNYVTLALSDTTGSTIEGRVSGTLKGSLTFDSQVTLNAVTSIPLVLKTANTERLRIDSSGRVMIGTQTVGPTAGEQLTIEDSANAGITIRSGTTAAGSILFEDDTADRGEIQYSHNGDYMRFKTAGTERLRIHSSGVAQFTTTGTQYASASVPAFVVNSNGDHALVINNQNTTDPRGLFIYQDQDVNNETSYFWRARAGGTDRAHLYSNGTLQLHSGNLKLASGSGIDFSATANSSGSMTSELLDDYEEGTFTPTDFSSANLTFTLAAGLYTRVGRMVHCQVRVKYPSTTSTAQAGIGNFPFTPTNAGANISNGSNASGMGYCTTSFIPQIHMNQSQPHTNLWNLTSGVNNNSLSTRELRFGVVYSVA